MKVLKQVEKLLEEIENLKRLIRDIHGILRYDDPVYGQKLLDRRKEIKAIKALLVDRG